MNIKKIAAFFVTLIILVLLPAQAMASTLSLSPSTGTINQGCTLTVQILLDTQNKQTDGTDAIILYDPSVFSASSTSITNNTAVYPDFPGNVVDNQQGKITISGLASVSQPFNGQGNLATIQFQVLSSAPAGPATINFDFDPSDKAKTTDSNVVERTTVVDTLNSVTNGNFTVGSGSGCTVTNSNPTPTPVGGINNPQGGGVPAGSSLIGYTPDGKPIYKTPQGGTIIASGSGIISGGNNGGTLPNGGFTTSTMMFAIAGAVLTVAGIIGLTLL
jgi:hypothetical protein